MTKVNVISGFLGAGKTTFIKELLEKVFKGKQIVLIENEFGEIGIDSGFLRDAGVQITEMNSGCICCSLVGDFTVALGQVVEQFHPERILIEPSGVGKLSDVEKAVTSVSEKADIQLDTGITVVDAKKAKKYRKNFGEFFEDQVKYADTIVLSRTSDIDEAVLTECVHMLRELNDKAPIVTTPWDQLEPQVLRNALDDRYRIEDLIATEEELEHHHHHHHDEDEEHEHHHHHDEDDEDDDEHEHHHHHHDEDEEHEHHHHHHDEDEDHEHHHHHDHDHEHHHHHHHGHDADEIFDSVGTETVHKYDKAELEEILQKLAHTEELGEILRAKGIVALNDGTWAEFDLVPGEVELRSCSPDYTGKVCVIGSNLKKAEVMDAFHL